MNLYVWDHLECMSSYYHSTGGVVVIAETVAEARALFLKDFNGGNDGESSDITTKEPDFVCGVDVTAPRLFTFPDAGCC